MPAERDSTYLRLPQDLKERLSDQADRRGISLTSAITELIEKGLGWDALNAELIQARGRIPKLELENQSLRDQVKFQAQTGRDLSETLGKCRHQTEQLDRWLSFPIASCKDCQKQANIVHIVYNQCPTTGGPSAFGFELLSQFERKAPIDVIRDFAPLVGIAGILIALASADDQKKA
jgi:hypothetical protein